MFGTDAPRPVTAVQDETGGMGVVDRRPDVAVDSPSPTVDLGEAVAILVDAASPGQAILDGGGAIEEAEQRRCRVSGAVHRPMVAPGCDIRRCIPLTKNSDTLRSAG